MHRDFYLYPMSDIIFFMKLLRSVTRTEDYHMNSLD